MFPLLLASGCAAPGPTVFTQARVDGETVQLRVEEGRFTAVGPTVEHAGATVVDLGGRPVVPGFVDAHVHLAYRPASPEMLAGGIAAVVDWGAPLAQLADPPADLQFRGSGPMLTRPGGYPTRSWGSDGYGLETEPADVEAAVDRLVEAGARVIKVPLQGPPAYDADTLRRIVVHAAGRDREVGVHALGAADAHTACTAGVGFLVHTPVERLPDETVAACAGTTVISTLTAFGGGTDTLENLRRLRAAGSTVLYGTDYGNTAIAGIQPAELAALQSAGLDGAAILQAATTAPAERFGFELGIRPGLPASFLVLSGDPLVDPGVLGAPEQVWVAGRRRR